MKAIVLAGGEGTRLRPLTAVCPKPMIRILDRPVLEYILALLHKSGIDDVCLTLKYLPDVVTAHFGDGSAFGVRLQSRLESVPLGTAGSVRSCLDFIEDEDVLVISGDCVCDFDLRSCVDFHRERGADATIVLFNHQEPTEYGLVVTGSGGRIERFAEKPPWENVVTGDVSTGIYILSPRAVHSIPDTMTYDFGRDLFPLMLRENRRLFAVRAEGYWCDIGSPESFLECCRDVLAGKVRLQLKSPRVQGGVWSSSFLPPGTVSAPPLYVGENVVIESDARLGPNTVIGSGSFIARGASVKNSIVDGAVIKAEAVLGGAIVGSGAVVGENAILREGCVIGDRCILGNDCIIEEKVKIWPSRKIPPGGRIAENVADGMPKSSLSFSSAGAVSGEFGSVITPESCLAVGSAAAAGPCGVAHDGKAASALLAEAICCGAAAAGGRVTLLDAPYPAAAAFAGGLYGLETTVFCSCRDGDAMLFFFGPGGIAVPRSAERRFEAALRGDVKRVPGHAVSIVRRITGSCDAFETRAVSECGKNGALTVAVLGRSPENKTLSAVLKEAGCTLSEQKRGIPSFEVSGGGFSLSAADEEGRRIEPDRMLLITALAAFEMGCREIAAPFSAPAALDRLAANMGGRVLRLERDPEEAVELYSKQPFMHYGAFAAALICRIMREKKATLAGLSARAPSFTTTEREVPIASARGEIMTALRTSCAEMATDLCDGLAAYTGTAGRIRIIPRRDRAAVVIRAENETEELAEELCYDFERRLRKLDAENADPQ